MAVVYIQLLYQVYILALIVTGTEIEAETISGTPDSLYTDNGSYSCIKRAPGLVTTSTLLISSEFS